MTTINLNQEQHGILQEILTSYLSDLSMEVGGTDKYEYREQLKHKEAILKEILAMLDSG